MMMMSDSGNFNVWLNHYLSDALINSLFTGQCDYNSLANTCINKVRLTLHHSYIIQNDPQAQPHIYGL